MIRSAARTRVLYRPGTRSPTSSTIRSSAGSPRDGRGSIVAAMSDTIGEATIEVISPDATDSATGASAAFSPIDDLLDDEELVEEISIDGMCGVY